MGKLIGNETTRVDIEDSWYLLRMELGWYQQKASGRADTMRLMVRSSALDQGEADEDDLLEVRMTTADRDLLRLKSRLAGWSHGEKMTEHNIKKIPPSHAAMLLVEIRVLENAQKVQELDEETKNE